MASVVASVVVVVVVSVVVSVVLALVVVSVEPSSELATKVSFCKYVLLVPTPLIVYSVPAVKEYALPAVKGSPFIVSPLPLLIVAVTVQFCATLNLILCVLLILTASASTCCTL